MLRDEPAPGMDNGATLLQFQTGALGWEIDDLLVTADEGCGRKLAISCKSNRQVTATAWPTDFVEHAWSQWNRREPGPMVQDADLLALVVRAGKGHLAFEETWQDIIGWASGDDDLALARIRDTAKHSAVFDSVRFPGGKDLGGSDLETLRLIRRLVFVSLDFQLTHSKALDAGARRCRDILVDGQWDNARKLWEELVGLATAARLSGGSLTLEGVWAHLRTRFDLKDRPNFAASWTALSALTDEYRTGILTALPSGLVIERHEILVQLTDQLASSLMLVHGDSGAGKSALVKAALGAGASNQVWLGPEQLKAALSEGERGRLGLRQPLQQVLQASSAASNVLVIDSSEKLEAATRLRAKELLAALLDGSEGQAPAWRVVVISQSDALADVLPILPGGQGLKPIAVSPLAGMDVQGALRATAQLAWLADDLVAVQALRNLKTLGWVIQAGAEFQTDISRLSPAAIADRVWTHWTQGNFASQQLLMQLAERESRFERSFALTDLDPAQATILHAGPTSVPLGLNRRNRLHFEHDLAADWARFQWLKQIADMPGKWAELASNPLWHSALRLLGQMLLREGDVGATAWDGAFKALARESLPIAADVLLDALYLDPEADRFMAERAEFLLARNGEWLERLLKRFLHIGTVPNAAFSGLGLDSSTDIYLEATFRMPIVARWRAVVGFLHANLDRVSKLMSPTVARVCEVWLLGLPATARPGHIIRYRKELAEIALACAREMQVQNGRGPFFLREGSRPLYSAALAAAPDLPAEIGAWALEMAERRPLAQDVAERIALARQEEERKRAADERKAPKSRAPQPFPTFISTVEELPPWPLGPADRVDRQFRKAVLNSATARPLIQACPDVAAEVTLACIIDGTPTRDRSSLMIGADLGLEHDDEGYPTIYWKGPFLVFLQMNPGRALTALISLVDFCTLRWTEAAQLRGYSVGPGITLALADGSQRHFHGGHPILNWAHHSDLGNGQLFCALNALEKWLTLRIDAGADVGAHLERLLGEGTSVAILGVLLNIAKYRPSLLSGALMPLVGSQALYDWALEEGHQPEFEGWKWATAGETAFELAKQWAFADYRGKNWLQDVVAPAIQEDARVAQFVLDAIGTWTRPEGRKAAIEFDLLVALLDADNYAIVSHLETGADSPQFNCPAALAEQIGAFQAENAASLQRLLFPMRCEQVLRSGAILADEEASALSEILMDGGAIEAPEAEGNGSQSVLIAATLVVCAAGWLAGQKQVERRCSDVLRQTVDRVTADHEAIRSAGIAGGDPEWKFCAHAVAKLWASSEPVEAKSWEAPLLGLLTSGDAATVGVIIKLAYENRERLGHRWWRLLHLGTLWSALKSLAPDYGDPPSIAHRWSRWLVRLRGWALADISSTLSVLDLNTLRTRVSRLMRARWRRLYAAQHNPLERDPSGRSDPGLGVGFLAELFDWLLKDNVAAQARDFGDERRLTEILWDYELRWSSDRRADDGEYPLSYDFGYRVVAKLAWIAANDPAPEADAAWRGVMALGPDAHHLVQHFTRTWFLAATEAQDAGLFARRWQAMIGFALDAGWRKGRRWYYGEQIYRQLMGLQFAETLNRATGVAAAIGGMRDLYRRWAMEHVGSDEDNVASFAHFLTSEAGKVLRLEAVQWIVAALAERSYSLRWNRDGAGDCMVALLDVMIAEDGQILATDATVRQAVLQLAADLASQHIAAAMTLQERIKRLGS